MLKEKRIFTSLFLFNIANGKSVWVNIHLPTSGILFSLGPNRLISRPLIADTYHFSDNFKGSYGPCPPP